MKSFWNQLDLVIFLLFVVAVVLRLQPQPDPYARVIYALTLMFAYLRFMENFYASKMIGPKIIMIQRMVHSPNSLSRSRFDFQSVAAKRPRVLHLHLGGVYSQLRFRYAVAAVSEHEIFFRTTTRRALYSLFKSVRRAVV